MEDTEKPVKKKKKSSKDAMALIKTDRQGIWKELRKVQKAQKKDVLQKRKKKKFKSAIGNLFYRFCYLITFILIIL